MKYKIEARTFEVIVYVHEREKLMPAFYNSYNK